MGLTALDTETNRGKAVLITTPNTFFEPRSWEDCIDFASRDKNLCAYNMDYDFCAFLAWLPKAIRNEIAFFPEVSFLRSGVNFRVRYIRKKFAKVWRDNRLQFTMYDLAQFHNCSLNVALEKMGIPLSKDSIPESWYSCMLARLRDPETRERVIMYGINDARLTQLLINKTVQKFKAAGIAFERPMSNASFAERHFREKFWLKTPYRVEVMARKSYVGARIEAPSVGCFDRAWLYDIRSAYPSVMVRLVKPDGTWLWNEKIRNDADYAYIDCRIEVSSNIHLGPVPCRDDFGICYPSGIFRRVITLPEYRLLTSPHYGGKVKLRVYRNVQHIGGRRENPFAEIAGLYEQRLNNPDVEYAIKILINSAYGKTAQCLEVLEPSNVADHKSLIFDSGSYRKVELRKQTTSFVYASEITSSIRCSLLQAVQGHEESVIMFATDSIMSAVPLDLPLSKKLGEWGVEEIRNVVVIGSGVYTYEKQNKKGEWERTNKFRGFNTKLDLTEILRKAGRKILIETRVKRNTTLKRALNRPKDFNVIKEELRFLNVRFDRKRYWPIKWNAKDLLTKCFKSETLVKYKNGRLEWTPLFKKG